MAISNKLLLATILRWIARIVSLAILAPIVLGAVLAAREGQLNGFNTSLHEGLIQVALWTIGLGALVGWKWEGIGGLLMLSGVAFFIWDHGFQPPFDTKAWLVPAFLYLVSWWITRRQLTNANTERTESATNSHVLKFIKLPLILVLSHAVFVGLVTAHIALSPYPEAGMVWIALVNVDYPISRCIGWLPQIFSSNALFPWTVLALGTIQWAIVGLILQQVINLLGRPSKRFRQDSVGPQVKREDGS